MRSLVVVSVLAGLACTPSPSTPDPPDAAESAPVPDAGELPDAAVMPPPTLRLATFNVHRFFDTVCDTGMCGPGAYEALPSTEEFQAQANTIAQAVRTIDADVVMLEEVETQTCLDALQAALGDAAYPVAQLGEMGTPATVDVAVLARGSLLEVRRHRDMLLPHPDGGTTRFARELLEVHVEIEGTRVIAFAAHFRSKSNDDPGRRLAEAVAAAGILDGVKAEFPDALIVLGGDLNDVPGSPPINALEEHHHRVASELSDDAAATYIFFGDRQAIDHLFTTSSDRVVPGSTFVHGGGMGFGGSDHSALEARFTLPCAQSSGGCGSR